MNDLLKTAYNRCKVDDWLDWDDPRYVSLDALGVRGEDKPCIDFLMSNIRLSNDATHQLFSGFRGCGKTSELKRLAHDLSSRNYRVVYIDTEEYLNLRVPASISDLLVTIAAGMDHYLGDVEPGPDLVPFRRFWDRFRALLGTDIEVKGATIQIPQVASLEVGFKKDPDFKKKLYRSARGEAAGAGAPVP